MFTSKGFFSQTACPHLQECHVPRCIFSHDASSPTPSQVVNPDEVLLEEEDHQSGQRKRRRLDGSPEKKLAVPKPANSKITLNVTSKTDTGKSLAALNRPISPPPLKRRPQQSTSSTTPSTPKPAVKPPAAINKNEVLNPRNLKGPAPAAYDLRLRLARALHEHFHRLNTELKKDASGAEEELILSEQGLIGKALDIEEEAARNPLIYTNVVKNQILAYKRMSMKQWVEERQREVAAAKAKIAAVAAATPITPVVKLAGPPKPIETGLTPEDELKLLPRLYTHITGLSQHGYVSAIPTDAEIEQASKGVEAAQGWEVCDRCKSRFQVFPDRREDDGALASGGPCTYHYGKPFFQERSAGSTKEKRVKKYRCCGEAVGDSVGCTQAENHVFKISEVKRQASIMNFVKTPENPDKTSDRPVCIDGEMGYTVYGLELIRLTATSWPSGSEIFDVLVRPLGGILDLNSRWSGVWPTDYAAALPYSSSPSSVDASSKGKKNLQIVDSPKVARDLLCSHLSPQTPLIGHGLENDLNAIRIIHPTIIDTVLLYPHKAGLPFRNGLKSLMALHLNRHIQVIVDGKMEGHDSKEDANAAGDLVRYKVKTEWENMRSEGWTLHEGVLKPPTPKVNLTGDGSSYFNVGESLPTPDVRILTGPRKRNREETPTGPRSLEVRDDSRNKTPIASGSVSPAPKRKQTDEHMEVGELDY